MASISSKDCSRTTRRRRSALMGKVRKGISLGEEEVQQRDELQTGGLPDILGPAGIRIPVEDILQLKSFFGFSWKKLRRLKRWLKERNITTGYEGGVRLLQEEIIGDNLDGMYLPLQFTSDVTKSLVIKETPFICVRNLTSLVFNLLDQYNDLGELTWHDGNIPADEVWIKIGGDKGGGTFKLMVQPANVTRPNSLANTRVVLLYPGGDSAFNLDVALSCFTPQVEELCSSAWRGKKIRVFAFGDYEYLTRMYGLSGPSGRHCCLWCTISRKDLAIPPHQRPPTRPRSLKTLHSSLEVFKQQGIPKEANNVVRDPFFTIPIEQVCPPGLHMSLGIHLKHYVSLAKSSHLLDMKIAKHLANSEEEKEAANEALKNHIKKLVLQAKAEELGEEVKELIEQHTMVALLYPENAPPTAILEMAQEKKKEKTKMEKDISKLSELPFGAGPISTRLEEVLQRMQVCRQAFHGGAFVGNHVHRSLQPHNVDKITESLLHTVEALCPTSDVLKAEAGATGARYNQLFHLFGACHRRMNSGSFLDEESITCLEEDIRSYMSFFRSNFPSETVTPKQHILENHTISWLRQWKASLGLLGEQGGESVHCQVNNISRDLRGYHDALKLNLQAVRSQWVQSSPNNYHKYSTELRSKKK